MDFIIPRIQLRPPPGKVVFDYTMITLGAALMALSYDLFLVPHKIVSGGAAGLATILYHLFRFPVGTAIFLINVPLFIWGLREFGRRFGLRTIYAVFITSFLTDFLKAAFGLSAATDNTLLATIYGAVLLGVGLGLAFRHQATTGGSDIVAQIIAKYTNATPGMGIMAVDFIIIALAGLTFGKVDLALYGFLALYVSGRLLDFVLEGWNYNKAAYIISDRWREIRAEVVEGMGRGGTVWSGKGFYQGGERMVLFCVVSRREMSQLRETVRMLDPKAFMVVTDAKEVLGLGFTPWSKVAKS